MEDSRGKERPPVVAGMFYPDSPDVLRNDITRYVSHADTALRTEAFGIIVPHAGYIYSAPVAAYAYKAVSAIAYDTAVIIGRSHHAAFHGAALDNASAYRTPLGASAIDDEIYAFLKTRDFIVSHQAAHREEHAIEVQIPFLQVTHPALRVVSLLLGTEETDIVKTVGGHIADLVMTLHTKRILIVCSTDLSHYHDYKTAQHIDDACRKALIRGDIAELERGFSNGEFEACGSAAVMTLLIAAARAGAKKTTVLDARSSGDTAGDKSRVVGYLSAVVGKS
ncbi:MAG: AmmeMemoRadiSam system protein B [Spirochaetes bacterium]|nr:AmmeMemoRadiSam system protein B [Spirochaetota bacterium]